MPFIPHTEKEIQEMLAVLGVSSIDELFDEIPKNLRIESLSEIPEGMGEMALSRLMQERAHQDQSILNFIGAGAYEHHIPAMIWEVATRGEWMTAYTPYQAEASQGTLQLLYEYQTMMARLMSMDVSNASLYDGASALAEAILMAVRCHSAQENPCILMPKSIHPFYRQVAKTIVQAQNITLQEIPYHPETGLIDPLTLKKYFNKDTTALVIPQPNMFGLLEDCDQLCSLAQEQNCKVIALVNPLSMALFKSPGEWGAKGADIACGEGQPLGIPLASGGPYFGFLTCKKEYIRQLPGRLVGRTTDKVGRPGYTLTLQAREQHIRRAKATSNICTNQGLLVTAATLYMSLMGAQGLYQVAVKSHQNTLMLRDKLSHLTQVEVMFPKSPFFHECVLKFKVPVENIIKTLAKQGIQAGFNLKPYYPELGESLLVCATETKTEEDLNHYAKALEAIVQQEVSVC